MRVRIRRFSSVELKHVQQPWKTERIEVSNRKCGLQGRAVGQTPGTMRTASGLSRKGRSDVPLAVPLAAAFALRAISRKPSLACQVLLYGVTGNDPAGRGFPTNKFNGPRLEPVRPSATNVCHGLTALIVRRIS
jgi:hypothetical protein